MGSELTPDVGSLERWVARAVQLALSAIRLCRLSSLTRSVSHRVT